MKRILLVSLLAAICFSCKIDVETDVYINDVLNAKNNQEKTFCTAQIKFDSSSSISMDSITTLLNKYFIAVQNIREDKSSYMGSIIADVQIPLTMKSNENDNQSIFKVVIDEDESNYLVEFKVDEDLFSAMNADVSDITYQKFDLTDLNIKFIINNDTKNKSTIGVHSVYSNSVPVPYYSEIEIDRRQKIEIVPSDVLRDSINGNGSITMLVIKK